MANETFTANQSTVFALDADGDGVIDPGEIVTTTVTITNNSTAPTPVNATGVQFTEDLQGMTLVNQAGDDINASPIAFDDSYTAAGNVAFGATISLLINDSRSAPRGSRSTPAPRSRTPAWRLRPRRAAASRSTPT